jgi:hypothetical protein
MYVYRSRNDRAREIVVIVKCSANFIGGCGPFYGLGPDESVTEPIIGFVLRTVVCSVYSPPEVLA